MDYNYLSNLSHKKQQNNRYQGNYNAVSASGKKTNQVASSAIQLFLARKQQEERQKYDEERRQKDKLLALRAQNSKSNRKAKFMASRTKENDFSKIKLTEDEIEAKKKREIELTNKKLSDKVDRMKARIELEKRDSELPKTRKRKSHIDKSFEISTSKNSSQRTEYKFNGSSVPIPVIVNQNKEKKEPIKYKPTPKLNFQELIKVAAKKQYIPIAMPDEDFEEDSDEYEEEEYKPEMPDNNQYKEYKQNSNLENNRVNALYKPSSKQDNKTIADRTESHGKLNNCELYRNKENTSNISSKSKPKLTLDNYKKSLVQNETKTSLQKISNVNNISNYNDISKKSFKIPTKKFSSHLNTVSSSKQSNNIEEEYIPQPLNHTVPKLYNKDLNHNQGEKSFVPHNKNQEIVLNKKHHEQTFRNHVMGRNDYRPKVIASSLKNNFNNEEKDYKRNSSQSIERNINVTKVTKNVKNSFCINQIQKTEAAKRNFKIPKKGKDSTITNGNDDTPCYFTDSISDNCGDNYNYSKKNKNHPNEKYCNYISDKNERRKTDNIQNKERNSLSDRNNIKLEQNKLNKNAIKRNNLNLQIENDTRTKVISKKTLSKNMDFEEPKQYFTVDGEEHRSKSTEKVKSKNKNQNRMPNEVCQYFTEDYKTDQINLNHVQNDKHKYGQTNIRKMQTVKYSLNQDEVKKTSKNISKYQLDDLYESESKRISRKENVQLKHQLDEEYEPQPKKVLRKENIQKRPQFEIEYKPQSKKILRKENMQAKHQFDEEYEPQPKKLLRKENIQSKYQFDEEYEPQPKKMLKNENIQPKSQLEYVPQPKKFLRKENVQPKYQLEEYVPQPKKMLKKENIQPRSHTEEYESQSRKMFKKENLQPKYQLEEYEPQPRRILKKESMQSNALNTSIPRTEKFIYEDDNYKRKIALAKQVESKHKTTRINKHILDDKQSMKNSIDKNFNSNVIKKEKYFATENNKIHTFKTTNNHIKKEEKPKVKALEHSFLQTERKEILQDKDERIRNKLNSVHYNKSAFEKQLGRTEIKKVIPASNMAQLMRKDSKQQKTFHPNPSINNKGPKLETVKQKPKEELTTLTKKTEKSSVKMEKTSQNKPKYDFPLKHVTKQPMVEKSLPSYSTEKKSTRELVSIKKPRPMEKYTSKRPINSSRDQYNVKKTSTRPSPKMFLKRNMDSEDDDDDDDEDEDADSMNDFIDDDSIYESEEDYSKYIRDIFGYDKRKYRNEDDSDDRAMETSYAQQLKEEKRSARIGYLEDLEDMRQEEEEKRITSKKYRK